MRFQASWEKTTELLEASFQDSGVRVVRSFDLQTARQGLLDSSSCPCPHHGTAQCTCQYLVYLIYADGTEPTTVVVHGFDDHTEISMEADDSREGSELWAQLRHWLAEAEKSS